MSLQHALLDLRLPILQAPMFLVSSQKLASACSSAGVVGAFQLANPRSDETLAQWLEQMQQTEQERRRQGQRFAPYCVNVNANAIDTPGYREKFALCAKAQVPLVLSSIGNPKAVVERVHDWGGRVIHDVTTLEFARKAIDAGVDGLMLTCAGSGGHTGALSPFAFLPQVRRQFDGLIVLAGGIADPSGLVGALALGADMICMGTRFIATQESDAPDEYKRMLVSAKTADVMESTAIAGLTANWLKPSMVAHGLDPDNLPAPLARHRPNLPEGVKAWKHIWSGGHSTGLVEDIPTVAELVERWELALKDKLPADWQAGIARRLGV
jgi:nitronate monooxygenase